MVSKRVMEAWELYQQGLSTKEIAEKMGITPGAVRKYIAIARKELGIQKEPKKTGKKVAKQPKVDKEITKIKEEVQSLWKELNYLSSVLTSVLEEVQRLTGNIEKINRLEERVRSLEKRIESLNRPISVPRTISISDQIKKLANDYNKLLEIAKKYYEINELLGNVEQDQFTKESGYWARKRYIGYYAKFSRFYAVAHVTYYSDWWRGNKELKEWCIVRLIGRKILSREELIAKYSTIRDQLLSAIEKLPELIEKRLPLYPENAEKVEKLYNELIKLLKGETQ